MDKKFWILMVLMLSLCGCVGTAGLKRTDLERWSVREFNDIGMNLEMPRKAALVEVLGQNRSMDSDSWAMLSFNLHGVWFGHFLVEPLYLVQFGFHRFSEEQYQSFRRGEHFWSQYWIWREHHEQAYTSVVRFTWRDLGRDVQGWRRDYPCSNGDVIVAGVEYIPHPENEPFRTNDILAIERILNSVREMKDDEK